MIDKETNLPCPAWDDASTITRISHSTLMSPKCLSVPSIIFTILQHAFQTTSDTAAVCQTSHAGWSQP